MECCSAETKNGLMNMEMPDTNTKFANGKSRRFDTTERGTAVADTQEAQTDALEWMPTEPPETTATFRFARITNKPCKSGD